MVAPDRLGYPENNPEKKSGFLRSGLFHSEKVRGAKLLPSFS
jgi:hypothetical protein